MKKFSVVLLAASLLSLSFAHAANEQQCQQLKDDADTIYAAKGFCFKDAAAKAKFGNENCFTTRPKFSEKEQQRLDAIKLRQKELNCPQQ